MYDVTDSWVKYLFMVGDKPIDFNVTAWKGHWHSFKYHIATNA